MTNIYYNNDSPLLEGTLAKANDINTDRDRLEVAFDKITVDIATVGTGDPTGHKSTIVNLFKTSTSSTFPPIGDFSGTFIYDFITNTLSEGTLNGWSATIPNANPGEFIWVRQATATSTLNSDAIGIDEWTEAVCISGIGMDGLNSSTVYLYRISNSSSEIPALFSGTFTYTFSTKTLSGGTLNSWTTTPPSVPQGFFLWQSQATASSIIDIDSIPTSEFSTPAVISGTGTDGIDGTGEQADQNTLDIQGWAFTGTFSATDANTVSWTSGTLSFSGGNNTVAESFSIVAGNTGNMAAKTYVFFSKLTSETILQLTTNATVAVGLNKIMIAFAEPGTYSPFFYVFGGNGGMNINNTVIGENSIETGMIQANAITANEIAANTITGNKIVANTLDSTHINTGSIAIGDFLNAGTFASKSVLLYTEVGGTKPPIDADKTQTQLDLGASIDNAKANGSTLISGGYIRTGLIQASAIVIGNLSGASTFTSYDTARVNGTAASTVSAYASSAYSHSVSTHAPSNADQTYTAINGGIISTGSIGNAAGTMNINFGTAKITVNTAAGLTIGGSGTINLTSSTNKIYFGSSGTSGVQIYGDSNEIYVASSFYNYIRFSEIWDDVTIKATSTTGANIILDANGTIQLDSTTRVSGTLWPNGNNTYRIGSSTNKWSEVWAVNGTIQTSDAADKSLIEPSDLGLDFINALQPKKWVWNDGIRPHYGLVAQDVEAVMTANNTDFAGLIKNNHTTVLRAKDDPTKGDSLEKGLIKKEQIVIETKEVAKDDEIIESHDSYGLRYHEFIGPMIKAIQQLNDKITALENKTPIIKGQ